MNWYHVKTRAHVDRFGVDKTDEGYMHSACAWTEDKLLTALKSQLETDGFSNLRIVEFRTAAQPMDSWNAKVTDLDAMLGI